MPPLSALICTGDQMGYQISDRFHYHRGSLGRDGGSCYKVAKGWSGKLEGLFREGRSHRILVDVFNLTDYAIGMRRKPIVAGVVAIAILLLTIIVFITARPSPLTLTIQHIKSTQSENVTTMSFEVTNHTADPYILNPIQVQVRNGNAWTKFEDFDSAGPTPIVPRGVAFYTVEVTNLPPGSFVRSSLCPPKILSGFNGFFRRAQVRMIEPASKILLNPNDKLSGVAGPPTEVVSDEWLETGGK